MFEPAFPLVLGKHSLQNQASISISDSNASRGSLQSTGIDTGALPSQRIHCQEALRRFGVARFSRGLLRAHRAAPAGILRRCEHGRTERSRQRLRCSRIWARRPCQRDRVDQGAAAVADVALHGRRRPCCTGGRRDGLASQAIDLAAATRVLQGWQTTMFP
jgi:hypothetical protein